jgi:hypothetical protein
MRARLYSRPGNDLTYRFPLIVEAIAKLRSRSCIIDGEADRWWARVSAEQGYEMQSSLDSNGGPLFNSNRGDTRSWKIVRDLGRGRRHAADRYCIRSVALKLVTLADSLTE